MMVAARTAADAAKGSVLEDRTGGGAHRKETPSASIRHHSERPIASISQKLVVGFCCCLSAAPCRPRYGRRHDPASAPKHLAPEICEIG